MPGLPAGNADNSASLLGNRIGKRINLIGWAKISHREFNRCVRNLKEGGQQGSENDKIVSSNPTLQ
jgi:hypothetical protein